MRQRIFRNVGGTIRFVPPEARLLGPPDAGATVTITTAQGGKLPTPVTAAPAVVDGFGQATTAPASAGDRVLALAAVAGLRLGGRYLIALPDGYLVVRIFAVQALSVYLYSDLPADVPLGALLRGVELSYVLSAAQAQSPSTLDPTSLYYANPRPPTALGPVDLTLFRAVWQYSISGAAQDPSDDLFNINARLLKSTLEPDELQPYLPGSASHLLPPSDTHQSAALLDSAWLELLDDCEVRGFKPDRIMDPNRLRKAHLYRTLAILGSTWGKDWADWATRKADEYDHALSGALAAGDWYDQGDTGLQKAGDVQFPSIRLVR